MTTNIVFRDYSTMDKIATMSFRDSAPIPVQGQSVIVRGKGYIVRSVLLEYFTDTLVEATVNCVAL